MNRYLIHNPLFISLIRILILDLFERLNVSLSKYFYLVLIFNNFIFELGKFENHSEFEKSVSQITFRVDHGGNCRIFGRRWMA